MRSVLSDSWSSIFWRIIENTQARAIVDEVTAAVADWRRFADAGGIAAREVRRIEQAFDVLQ
jgi:hypothetical protein